MRDKMILNKILITLLLSLMLMMSYGQFRTNTSLGGNYNNGNSGLFLTTMQSDIHFDSTKFHPSIQPYFCYSEVKSSGQWVTKQRESYLATSFYSKYKDYNLYLFTDVENSLLKQFNIKASVGFGIGKYIKYKNTFTSTSIALMPEYYSSFTNRTEKSLRLSFRVHYNVSSKVNFNTVTLIQPAILMDPFIGYGNNFNFRSTNSLTYPITNNLSIGCQVLVATSTLSTYTVPALKPTDLTTSFIIIYKQ